MLKKRQSNIELLRILAIICIISFHYVYKSGYVLTDLNANSLIIKSFWFLGELGVNLFILITGYFLINSKFSFKKLIKLIIEVNFYYLITLFVSLTVGKSIGGGVTALFPNFKTTFLRFFAVIFNRYWFITAYILIYILSPYLNKFIKSLTKNEHKKLLIIILTIWSIIPTFFGIFNNNTESLLYYNRFIWLIILYFLGAYIKLYSLKFFNKNKIKRFIMISLISFTTMILGVIIIYHFKDIFLKIGIKQEAYFWQPNSIPMIILSIAIFELFLNFKIKNNKLINLLASTTLGIYMLHDGPLANILWKKVFKSLNCLNSKYAIIYIIVHTFIIFIVGSLIDLIRQLIEKNTLDKFLNSKLSKKIENKSKMLFHKIYNFI